ncbi:MAG: gamma-carotene 1'-hydroxylase CruF [Microcoleaceae cyanobacterium]
MKPIAIAERFCLTTHVISTVFGLAGLLIVLPSPEIIASLPPIGMKAFQMSMAGGGATYIVFGALAVALYAYRNWGAWVTATFLVPSVGLSLCSELLGTSTGFPFGSYAYLSGLGYKIAGLVPFTIPLSWFYMGLSCYLLARSAVQLRPGSNWIRQVGALLLGAVLLTAWDLVLDPAMSQAPVPFWQFQEVGEFFGMPYRNLLGWVGTGLVFMTVSAFLWRQVPIMPSRRQLTVPVIVYLTNFLFGAVITVVALDNRFLIPVGLSVAVGLVPAIVIWLTGKPSVDFEAGLGSVGDSSVTLADSSGETPLEAAAK